MKHTLILALALGLAPAFAGQATLVEFPNTAPAVVAPACTGSAFAIEVGPNYTSMIDGIEEGILDIDTVGVDVTGVYNIDSNWAVTLRFSWATGDKTEYDNYLNEIFKCDVTNWSIAPGIRYTVGLTENLSAFAGANVGYGNTDIKVSAEIDSWSESFDDSGLIYGIEAGLKYDLCESVYLYGAAQYWGTTAQPSFEGAKADKQNGINFRLGVGVSF